MSPAERVGAAYARIAADRARDPAVWITTADEEVALARAAALDPALPLAGWPLAVKDNIDVAGLATTCACPGYTRTAHATAPCVARLEEAGAVVVGKTNMDQFATGLVGTRTPYGIPHAVADPRYIAGGSSSGSAIAVAAGLVPIALGTDTAGSGRVPAAFNGIVGLKPTRGLVSTRGVVPASRSFDCVSVFARTVGEAWAALGAMEWPDPRDPYARARPSGAAPPPERPRVGVPAMEALGFLGDAAAAEAHAAAVDRMAQVAELVEVDVGAFLEAGRLLYGGALVAERVVAYGDFVAENPDVVDPSVRTIVERARALHADRFAADLERLAELRMTTAPTWDAVDALLLPTVPTTFTIAQVQAAPLDRNAELGAYTNFVNLLDLAALAVPAGTRSDGLPWGVSLIAPAFSEPLLVTLGARLAGEPAPQVATGAGEDEIAVAVVGAHLEGQPLNHQLTDRGGRLLARTRTAPAYRLYALADTVPPKPGLVHADGGTAIEVEVWALDARGFGELTALVAPPLAIGTITLEDGSAVKGFVCEPRALDGALEITGFGGWRAFLASRA